MQLFTNNARSTLATGISNSAAALSVAAGEGALFPALSGGDFFMLTILTSSGGVESDIEIVMVTARSGDNMTITRGQEGTAAVVHASGSVVSLRDTAKFFNDTGTALAAKEVTANKDASGGYAGRTAYKLNMPNDANTFTSLLSNVATGIRNWVMPDKSGTVAMTSDITGTNSGTNTGDQTISLTGDVTGSGTGTFAATIANNAVTLGKMATMATASLLGRSTAGTGSPEVLSAATAKGLLSLNNVDNTSDANKPVSSAQATAIALKQDASGKDASGGYAGLTAFKLNMKNVANTFTSFFTNSNTAARTYTLPDKDGTVAMLSDLSSTTTQLFRNIEVFIASGTITWTARITGTHRITLQGASGSAGAALAIPGNSAAASGGSTGGQVVKTFDAVAGDSYTLTLGVKGAQVTVNSSSGISIASSGNDATDSTFSGTGVSITAGGGKKGNASISTSGTSTALGAVGGTASGGDFNYPGGASGTAMASLGNCAATGGAAMPHRGVAYPSGSATSTTGSNRIAGSGGAGVGGKSGDAISVSAPAATSGGGYAGASPDAASVINTTVGIGTTTAVPVLASLLNLSAAGTAASTTSTATAGDGAGTGAVVGGGAGFNAGAAGCGGGGGSATGLSMSNGTTVAGGSVGYGGASGAAALIQSSSVTTTATGGVTGAAFAIIESR